MNRAGEKDVKKIMELIWGQIKKLTAKDVGALSVAGGTITGKEHPILTLDRTEGNITALRFQHNGENVLSFYAQRFSDGKNYLEIYDLDGSGTLLLGISQTRRTIYDYKTGKLKDILVDETPTVKETKLVTNNAEHMIKVYGQNNGIDTDITDIFNKANTMNEGLAFGVCSNHTGYIIGQNFNLDCTRLTDDERTALQSFANIIVHKDNDSDDYPTLVPANINSVIAATVRCKTGYKTEVIKTTMISSSARIRVMYNMPTSFRTDDNSQNNLSFVTNEWIHMYGTDIKNRG